MEKQKVFIPVSVEDAARDEIRLDLRSAEYWIEQARINAFGDHKSKKVADFIEKEE